jgi:hypothetical protein
LSGEHIYIIAVLSIHPRSPVTQVRCVITAHKEARIRNDRFLPCERKFLPPRALVPQTQRISHDCCSAAGTFGTIISLQKHMLSSWVSGAGFAALRQSPAHPSRSYTLSSSSSSSRGQLSYKMRPTTVYRAASKSRHHRHETGAPPVQSIAVSCQLHSLHKGHVMKACMAAASAAIQL